MDVTLLPALTAKVEPATQVRWIVQPRPRWRLALGGALLGAGAVVGGFGVSGLSVDKGCKQSTDPGCTGEYQTGGIGGGLLGVGIGLVGAGVVLMAIPGSRQAVAVPSNDTLQN